MKRPAVFFDRDNTLIACDDYLGDPGKVQLVPGAADAVARARALGYAAVVFSNQSGVARGFFDEPAVHAVNQRMDELLAEQNPRAVIDRHEFCPFHPDGTAEAYRQESDRRKPGAGMIYSAAEALALDLSRSWVIGDAPRDIEAGKTAGLRTILFSDPALSKSPAADARVNVPPDFSVATLNEAMEIIEREMMGPQRENVAASVDAGRSSGETPPVDEPRESNHHEADTTRLNPSQPSIVPTGVVAHPQSSAKVIHPEHRKEVPHVMAVTSSKLETIGTEILRELRRREADEHDDFSVSKLLAGIVQVVVLAVLFVAYLYRHESHLVAMMLLALTLQTMTIALLIMGKQR